MCVWLSPSIAPRACTCLVWMHSYIAMCTQVCVCVCVCFYVCRSVSMCACVPGCVLRLWIFCCQVSSAASSSSFLSFPSLWPEGGEEDRAILRIYFTTESTTSTSLKVRQRMRDKIIVGGNSSRSVFFLLREHLVCKSFLTLWGRSNGWTK